MAATAERLNVFDDVTIACNALARKDRFLARAIDAIGAPHIRRRTGGFEALFRIIVEQQVSVPSAQAIWARCTANVDPLTPARVIHLGADGLRNCGLSRPKARYVLALASKIDDGDLDPAALPHLDNESAAEALTSIIGIGPWSAAIYLLFCEGRVDIWPPGDVALLGAYNAARLRGAPAAMAAMDEKAMNWRPYRGVAAHILWTYYAHLKGRKPI